MKKISTLYKYLYINVLKAKNIGIIIQCDSYEGKQSFMTINKTDEMFYKKS